MKAKILIISFASLLVVCGCSPMEDKSLRDDFNKAGTPISQADLDAALSVTQPYPNLDDAVEGDQYVVLKNERPDIGGVWHVGWSTGIKTVISDNKTVIYDANGEFDIYFTGVSANQTVRSRTFHVSVTNCFDEYDTILSGAVDKADVTAQKTWKLVDNEYAIHDGMNWGWQYYPMKELPVANMYKPPLATATELEKTLVLKFGGKVMEVHSGGTVKYTGNWTYTHDVPQSKVIGEFISSIPVLGVANYGSGLAQHTGTDSPYWIVDITKDNLVLCLPKERVPSGEWWNDHALYFFFKPVNPPVNP